MLARRLLIGVIALATLPALRAQTRQPPRVLPSFEPLTDGVSITVVEQPDTGTQPAFILVQLSGQSTPNGKTNPNPKPLSGMAIQLWLLRTDGTAVPQHGKPGFVGLSNMGEVTDMMSLLFEDAPTKDLAGVVVSVNGKFYVREIKAP